MQQRSVAGRALWLKLLIAAAAMLSTSVFADELAEVQKLAAAGQRTEALQRADQALALNPKDAQMRFLKGVILAEQWRTTDAIGVFLQLTKDYPELPEPYNNLATLYASQSQYDKARIALEMAVRLKPGYAQAYENLGDVYAKLASQAYAKALQIDAGNESAPPKLALIREMFATRTRVATEAGAAAPPRGKPTTPSPKP